MALPKNNRLSLRTSKDLFLNSKKYHSTQFSLTFVSLRGVLDNNQDDVAIQKTQYPQFAIIVSKKTARKAHDRHKIRRLTSAIIYRLLDQFNPGYYLIFPKNTVLTTPFSDLVTDLTTISRSLRLARPAGGAKRCNLEK